MIEFKASKVEEGSKGRIHVEQPTVLHYSASKTPWNYVPL